MLLAALTREREKVKQHFSKKAQKGTEGRYFGDSKLI